MKTPSKFVLIPLAASGLLFLTACGNKGPLVMPQQPVPVEEIVEPVDGAEVPATQPTGDGSPVTTPDPVPLQDDDTSPIDGGE